MDKLEEDQEQLEPKKCFDDEVEVIHKVKTVSEGSGHKHILIPDWKDSDGRQHYVCSKCWQGDYK